MPFDFAAFKAAFDPWLWGMVINAVAIGLSIHIVRTVIGAAGR